MAIVRFRHRAARLATWSSLALTLPLCPALASAASLQAYALSAAGTAVLQPPFGCSTFAPDPDAAWFVSTFQVSLPTDGAVCGVGVDRRSITAASGPVAAASNLAVGWGPSTDLRSFVGSAGGRARFGDLGVRASARYSGTVDGFTVAGSQAFGLATDELTFGGASGNGWFLPTFTVDGSLFNVGRTDSQLVFMYAIDDGPHYLGFRLQNSRGTLSFYDPSGYVPGFPGMSVTGDLATGLTVAGSTQFTLALPITFGQAAAFSFGLWAAVLPSSSVGQLTASSGDVSFYSSARLTGIQVLGPGGQALPDFTISAASGTLYGVDGVPAVPEPGTAVLALLGGAVLCRVLRRRPAPACG